LRPGEGKAEPVVSFAVEAFSRSHGNEPLLLSSSVFGPHHASCRNFNGFNDEPLALGSDRFANRSALSAEEQEKEEEHEETTAASAAGTCYAAADGLHFQSTEFREFGCFHVVLVFC
jgi:hypothetical protein